MNRNRKIPPLRLKKNTSALYLGRFLAQHGLIRDGSRPDMGNIIGNEDTKAVLGYEQMVHIKI